MTATDWDGFALQLAVWSTDTKHTPLSWRVIAPGTSASLEERQTMDGYLAARDSGAYTNEAAASVGWPLPHPETASPLMLRKYDRKRFPPGMVTSNRLEAAILAPGDFPDVDTSVEPPRYKVAPVATPVVSPVSTDVAATPPPTPPTARVLKVGDHVVVRTDANWYAPGVVNALLHDTADGAPIVAFVQLDGATAALWREVIGWTSAGTP